MSLAVSVGSGIGRINGLLFENQPFCTQSVRKGVNQGNQGDRIRLMGDPFYIGISHKQLRTPLQESGRRGAPVSQGL